MLKNLFLWVLIAIVFMYLFDVLTKQAPNVNAYTYSEFLQAVDKGDVKDVVIQNQEITGRTKDGKNFKSYLPMEDQSLMPALIKKGINVQGKPPASPSLFVHFLLSLAPFVLLILVWLYFMRQMQGGGSGKGGPMSFGRSRARFLAERSQKHTS